MASNKNPSTSAADGSPEEGVGRAMPAGIGNLNVENLNTDVSSSASAIQDIAKLFAKTDRLSLLALQSKTFEDGKTALDSFNPSFDALKTLDLTIAQLSSTTQRLREELSQRRAHITPPVYAVYNAKQPVMRLSSDVLRLIIEILACIWMPSKKDLGWIKTTHVCAAWRSAIVSLAPLWARELGVFPSDHVIRAISLCARDAPTRFRNNWSRETGILSKHQWRTLAHPNRMHTLDLRLTERGVEHLVGLLRKWPDNDLRVLSVSAKDDCTEETYAAINSLPNLRCVSYEDVCIPLSAPILRSLSLHSRVGSQMDDPCSKLLNMLEPCQNLVFLKLSGWTSSESSKSQQVIQLPCLETFIALRPQPRTKYASLCRHLDLPMLGYLQVEDQWDAYAHYSRPNVPVAPAIFKWLLAHKQELPCIRSANELSMITVVSGHWNSTDNLQICLDDGGPESIVARSFSEHTFPSPAPDGKRGVHIHMRAKSSSEFSRILGSTIIGCLTLYGHSAVLPVVKKAHLDFRSTHSIDWSEALQDMVDAEALRVPFCEFHKLLPALSVTSKDGTMLLPRLKTIICEQADNLAQCLRGEYGAKSRVQSVDRIKQLLSARSVHGAPVTTMKALCFIQENEKEVNAFFADAVSSYV